MWVNSSQSEKFAIITNLHKLRDDAMKQRPSPIKAKRHKSSVRKMHFASPELEKIFNTMPVECQRLVMGKHERNKV